MKTKVLVGILLFLIVINLSTIGVFVYHLIVPRQPDASLFPLEGMPRFGMMGPGGPMMNFQPEVREQMKKLMTEFREEIRGHQERIADLEDSTVVLLKNDPPPMGRISENLKQLSDLRLLVNQKAVHNLLKARQFLSPDQLDMFFHAIVQARPNPGRMGGAMPRGSMRGRGMGGMQERPDTIEIP